MEDDALRPFRAELRFLDRVALRGRAWGGDPGPLRDGLVTVGQKIYRHAPGCGWPGELVEECADERAAELRARELLELQKEARDAERCEEDT